MDVNVKFDSIKPLPSGAVAQRAEQRAAERQQRQARGTALRREQLLGVAFGLFEQVGISGFNMRLMAQRAGYAPGALYAYFRGKEAILSALRQQVIDQLADEVRAVQPPKSGRVQRAVAPRARSASLPLVALAPEAVDLVAEARALFMAQSVAWWRCLDREPHRLQLLLKSGGLPEPAAEPGDPQGDAMVPTLGRLTQALAPCQASLHAMGLPADVAELLHVETLAYGLGLLVLQEAGPRGTGLEARFLQTLQRWVDHECRNAVTPEADAHDPAACQGDLFAR